MALTNITPEQRQEYIRLAAEARERAKQLALDNLRNDFADKRNWKRLASHYGIVMPAWYDRSTRRIRRALKALGYDGSWVKDQTGFTTLKEWMQANPAWPSYAFVGLILESAHERDKFVDLGLDEGDEDEADDDLDIEDDLEDESEEDED